MQAQDDGGARDAMGAEGAEGWFVDPFGRHERRWLSDGRATSLVRDGRVEGVDVPPDTTLPAHLERAPGQGRASPADVRRAGDVGGRAPSRADVLDVVYDRNLFLGSVPMGYRERADRNGRGSRRNHWWVRDDDAQPERRTGRRRVRRGR